MFLPRIDDHPEGWPPGFENVKFECATENDKEVQGRVGRSQKGADLSKTKFGAGRKGRGIKTGKKVKKYRKRKQELRLRNSRYNKNGRRKNRREH